MSKFVDKLNEAQRTGVAPMGFGRPQAASPSPKILLVAYLAGPVTGDLAGVVAGADAGLVSLTEAAKGKKALEKCVAAVPDIPWGGWLGGTKRGWAKSKTPGDYLIFGAADTTLKVTEGSEAGKIIEVSAMLRDGLLRALNKLPVDGVLLSDKEDSSPLNWQQLLVIQHVAALLTKPLLMKVTTKVSALELKALWEAGVAAVVIEAAKPGELGKLRQEIDKLPFSAPRKQGAATALLPHLGQEKSLAKEAPDDDEE